jgi:hypothetical protein
MTDAPKRKVGVLLFIGILLAPIVFAWFLLRSGYSRRARIISFVWLAAGIAAFFLIPRPEPTRSASEQPAPLVERQATSPRIAYVSPMEIDQRSTPNGPVVNRLYRGQRLEVFEEDGEWARVTAPGYDQRWVRLSELSDGPPAEMPQPDLPSDPRLESIPRVGEYGHTEADVRALRAGALELLNSGQCSRIDDANKSVNVAGVYYVNCGEPSNRFFRMQDNEPHFCGRSADGC